MRIALIGYGKMGREIEAIAREQGETIACVFDSKRLVCAVDLSTVDVCIEFSTPSAVLTNIRTAIAARKDIVVGTTGWHQHLPELKEKIRDSGLLYSANFSLGMNIFQRIVARAGELVANAPAYDPFIHETHHRLKADSPSGTALRLGEILLGRISRKKRILAETSAERIAADALHVTSTRAGAVTGTHRLPVDC